MALCNRYQGERLRRYKIRVPRHEWIRQSVCCKYIDQPGIGYKVRCAVGVRNGRRRHNSRARVSYSSRHASVPRREKRQVAQQNCFGGEEK